MGLPVVGLVAVGLDAFESKPALKPIINPANQSQIAVDLTRITLLI
jgi:hypothetical protein